MQEEDFLKRYLQYCRVKCSPRLTQRAGDNLVNIYVDLRGKVCPSFDNFAHACNEACHLIWLIDACMCTPDMQCSQLPLYPRAI